MGKVQDFFIERLGGIAERSLRLRGKMLLKRGKHQTFIRHVMATDFNAKPLLKTANPYFLQWGLHFPMLEAKYYERMTGIKADHYVPYALLSQFLIPFLNGTEPTLDKNDLRKMFGATLPNKRVPFLMAEQVVYNKGGIFYDGNDECIPVDEAVRLVMKYDKDIIMKPTVDTTWGKGVAKFCLEEKNEKEIEQ